MSTGDNFLNGFLFENNYIPAEVIVNILMFTTWEDLLSCRLVCKSWKEIINLFVGIEKVKKCHKSRLNLSFTTSEIKLSYKKVPFYLYFAIGRNVFGHNHLKNPFGKDEFQHECHPKYQMRHWDGIGEWLHKYFTGCPNFRDWKVYELGKSGWVTEDPPIGCDPIPDHIGTTSCFVTSCFTCTKQQLITFQECGLNNKIMDEIQPHLEVSEWFARRWDCGVIYKMKVTLLNTEKKVVDVFIQEVEKRNGDSEWHQISHTFKDYGPGVRYIVFCHGGCDTQSWGSSVIARIPASIFAQTAD